MERVPYRLILAAGIFLLALVAMISGVGFSERTLSGGLLEYAYYALSLFVIGGVDLGTPEGGPGWARSLLWAAFFAAPILTVSAIIDAIFRVFSLEKFRLRRARNHVVITGADHLAEALLSRLRAADPKALAVLICNDQCSASRLTHLRKTYDVLVVVSDVIDDYILDEVRIDRAARMLILGHGSLEGYELAHKVLQRNPELISRITVHCEKLRFMRAMANTAVAADVQTFNAYQRAAQLLVDTVITPTLAATDGEPRVVISGFGRFGQSILEQLQERFAGRVLHIAILAEDAVRRILVTKEQVELSSELVLHTFQGDISHPQIWADLDAVSPIDDPKNLFIMATDRAEDNLRTALWLRRKNETSLIVARSHFASPFTGAVGRRSGIEFVSVGELAGRSIPEDWLLPD